MMPDGASSLRDRYEEPPPESPKEAAQQIAHLLLQIRNAVYYAMFLMAILAVILVFTA